MRHSFIVRFSLFIALLSLSWCAMANVVPLYDQPKADAKTVGSVDLSAGIIPIYSPSTGEWVKVADPRNGNVGWLKSSVLGGGTQSVFTFSQGTINGGKVPSTYRIIQYGQPHPLSKEQAAEMMKRIAMQQQSIHQAVKKSMESMFQEMNLFSNSYPIMMPVWVVPVYGSGSGTGNAVKPDLMTHQQKPPVSSTHTQ